MKLIPEQVRMLREKKEELLQRKEAYREYCSDRDRNAMEGVGAGCELDYQHEVNFAQTCEELNEINRALKSSEFVTERNFEFIDIGTSFIVSMDGEKERMLLVEAQTPVVRLDLAASNSDFGRAVQGKKAGDEVNFKVQATGREISLKIEEIESLEEKYEHFIREKKQSNRISKVEKQELRRLRLENKEAYLERQMITNSQKRLLEEELSKIPFANNSPSVVSKRNSINKRLATPIAMPPEDDTIGVGSHVTILLQDDNGEYFEKSFEFINMAVSTELDSHYVERISALGHSLFGLEEKDEFEIRRKHKASIRGIVKSVDNSYEKEKRLFR